MAINKNKIVAQAQKFTAKGQFDKAIAEYQKLLEAEPGDIRTWLKIGDLYTRKGARKEATATYLRVAEHYTKSGFHLKAVAVYKQILKLDPTLFDVHRFLADAYINLGLNSEALIQLEQLADVYQRTNRSSDMLSVLTRMGEIDPHNIATRLRIAEYLSREKRVDEAVGHFAQACQGLRAQGRFDDYLKVAERLLYHDSSHVEIAREAASIYLERAQYKRALSRLQLCFVKDPRHLPTLELLARSFEGLDQPDKAISVYKEIALLLKEEGDEEKRQGVLQEILRIDPNDRMALDELSDVASGGGPGSVAPAAAAGPISTVPPRNNSGLPSPAMALGHDPSSATTSDSFSDEEFTDQLDPEDIEEVEELEELSEQEMEEQCQKVLSETEVLLKYGLKDRAVQHIQKVFELDPEHIDARERLKDILLDMGRVDEALEQLFYLAEVFRESQPEGSIYYLHEILRIDPGNETARDMIHQLGGIMPEEMEETGDLNALDLSPSDAGASANIYVLDEDVLSDDDKNANEYFEEPTGIEGFDEPTILEKPIPKQPSEDRQETAFDTGASASGFEERVPAGFAEGDEDDSDTYKGPTPREFDAGESAEHYEIHESVEDEFIEELDEEDYDEVQVLELVEDSRVDVVPGEEPEDLAESEADAGELRSDDAALESSGGALVSDYEIEDLPFMGADDELSETRDVFVESEEELAVSEKLDRPISSPPPQEGIIEVGEPFEEPEAAQLEKPEEEPEAAQLEEPEEEPEAAQLEEPEEEPEAAQLEEPEEEPEAAQLDEPEEEPDSEELEEALEEAEFFFEQELYEEARGVLEAVLETYADHPRVKALMAQIEPQDEEADVEPEVEPAPERETERYFDPEALAEEMDFDDFDQETSDDELQEVFTQFKEGVKKQVGDTDFSTHYDLGIAYKEMGLYDDAIKEFEISSGDADRVTGSKMMIGMCYVGLNSFDRAVEVFREALDNGIVDEQQRLGLLYELGKTYQLQGSRTDALDCFQEIISRDSAFADVAYRVAELQDGKAAQKRQSVF